MPFQSVGDINIHYQIQGKGPPLLLIIGLSLSLHDWGKQLPSLLAPHFQLILLDNRDAGLTSQSDRPYTLQDMADDTAGLLEALNIPQAYIFGVSMGGAIAQHLALRHPNKVDRLILGCTFAGGNCSQSGDLTPLLNGNLAELLFTPDYIKDNQPRLQTFLDQNAPYRSTPQGLSRQLNAIATHDTCTLLPQINAPTLVITGDRDTAVPPSNSHFLAKTIPRAKLEIIPDAAHAFSYSHGAETSQLIQSFLS